MKNKKFKICISIMSLLLIFIALYSYSMATASSDETADNNIFSEWGEYLSNNNNAESTQRNDNDQSLYAKGNHVDITLKEMEQVIKFYELQGNSPDDSQQLAYDYLKESNALYQAAISAGFAVTNDEVVAYVEEMRATYNGDTLDAESKESFALIIAEFESEDAYWDYQIEVYQKQLPCEKYNNNLYETYFTEHNEATEDDYNEFYESHKQELVELEDFQIVNQ